MLFQVLFSVLGSSFSTISYVFDRKREREREGETLVRKFSTHGDDDSWKLLEDLVGAKVNVPIAGFQTLIGTIRTSPRKDGREILAEIHPTAISN